ncbi:MAG: MFS transporter, partial [Carbonactinosporaceae bacterium]
MATTCGLLAVFVTSALAPQLHRDVGVSAVGLGVAVAVFFGAGTVAAPLCGRLADRVGSVRVMRLALALAAASLACVGLAVHGWVGLVVALGFAGAANGAIQPSANRYISRLTPERRQGLAFGIKQAAIPAAILLGGLSVPVAAYLTGWRAVYLGAAALAVAVALSIRVPPVARRSRSPGAPGATAGRLDR